MTLTEAIERLSALGFTMGAGDVAFYGVTEAESFDYKPNHVLSTPRRDVFIAQMYEDEPAKTFCYITSHIKFRGRKYRCRNSYDAQILNIFASGKTVEHAVIQFEHNFRNKVYNVTA